MIHSIIVIATNGKIDHIRIWRPNFPYTENCYSEEHTIFKINTYIKFENALRRIVLRYKRENKNAYEITVRDVLHEMYRRK